MSTGSTSAAPAKAAKGSRTAARSAADAVQRDPRWAQIRARNPAADGTFYYAVKTTGVYCRPSCGARPARPENVEFHGTPEEAERAGYRACKRCKPRSPPVAARNAARIEELCRFIETSEENPSLEQLAKVAGLSVHHMHRLFRSVTGMTPKRYAAAHRSARVRRDLPSAHSVTEAIYRAGFGSSGRFYEKSKELIGMTPREYRAGGDTLTIRFAVGECSLGSILVAATTRGVCAILLGDDPEQLTHDLERRFRRAQLVGGDGEFESLVAKVVGLIDRPSASSDLPLDIRGTVFQQRVWEAISRIPRGTTMTYAQIAEAIGEPRSVRAVAQACGANALAVAIPCHRVIRTDGGLSGYRWGLERKRKLLENEART